MTLPALPGFEVLEDVGAGAMGRVYRARRIADALDVAIKVVRPSLVGSGDAVARFHREAGIGMRLDHPGVVRVHDHGAVSVDGVDTPWLVMEWVEGQTLRALLADMGPVPEPLVRTIAAKMADALTAIHGAGVVHRDLKPENVVLTPTHDVRIMDLGIAHVRDATQALTQDGAFLGSLAYAAPEQVRGRGLDGRADLHGLGVLLFELLTGGHPYPGRDAASVLHAILHLPVPRIRDRIPELSPWLDVLVAHLMAKAPEDRPATGDDVVRRLEAGPADPAWRGDAGDAPRGRVRVRVARSSPFVGREDELATLRTAWDAAVEGRGQVVLLEGEAGIGTSRLLDRFVEGLAETSAQVLYGAWPPGGGAVSAGAWLDGLRAFLGDDVREDVLARHLPGRTGHARTLAAVYAGDGARLEAGPPALRAALVEVLGALAEAAPTIWIVEDLHLADDEARAIFAAQAHRVSDHPALLIGTSRAGTDPAWRADLQRAGTTCLEVPRMASAAMEALVQPDLASSGREAWAPQIVSRADGNPWIALELVRHVGRQAQPDVREDVAAPALVALPDSVDALLRGRLQGLPEAARELLDVAACLGHDFDPEDVALAVRQRPLPVFRQLAQVEAHHQVVRAEGRGMRFDHALLREVLLSALPEALRRQIHRAIVDAWESRGGPTDHGTGAEAARRCHHLAQAGDWVRAEAYVVAAVEHRVRSYQNDAAIALAREALDAEVSLAPATRLALHVEVTRALDRLRRWDEARVHLEAARDLARELQDTAALGEAGRLLGTVAREQGRLTEAVSLLEEAEATYRQAGRAEGTAASACALGAVLEWQGDMEGAQRAYERAHAVVAGQAPSRGLFMACLGQGSIHLHHGRYGPGTRWLTEAMETARSYGDRAAEAAATGNLGMARSGAGDAASARALYRRGIALYREVGDGEGEARLLATLGTLDLNLGRTEAAIDGQRHALALHEAAGDTINVARVHHDLGESLIQAGRAEEAETHFQTAQDTFDAAGYHVGTCYVLSHRVAWRVDAGRLEEAGPLAARAVALAKQTGTGRVLVRVLALRAQLPGGDAAPAAVALDAQGDTLEAPLRVEVLWRLWRATGEDAWRVRGRVEARDHLSRQTPEDAATISHALPPFRALLRPSP